MNAPPTNNESPGLAERRGAAVAEADKSYATLRAGLALRGFELHVVSDDTGGAAFTVYRWNLSRTLPDLASVRDFAQRVGVPV